jgi:hypothetical protein
MPSRGFEYQGLIGKHTRYAQTSQNFDGGQLPGLKN